MGKSGTEQNALNCTQTPHHWVDRTLPHGDNSRAQKWTQVPEHLHGHYLILISQPLSGIEDKIPLTLSPWSTHHLRKAQLTSVSLLDHELHEGRLGCWVSTVFPASGVPAGAQEGLREYQQRREGHLRPLKAMLGPVSKESQQCTAVIGPPLWTFVPAQ